MCLKGRPSVVIYELRANSISNGLLHFVTGDKRAGHTLSPLNELTRPRKKTPCLSHIYIHCRNTHTHTQAQSHITHRGHTNKCTEKSRHWFFLRPINTCSHTLLTRYPELPYPPSHRPLTGARPDFSQTRHPGSKGSSVVWRAGRCWGPRGAFGGDQAEEFSHIPFGSLWSKGPGGLKGGTLLKNTCDNDVIWLLQGLLGSCWQ